MSTCRWFHCDDSHFLVVSQLNSNPVGQIRCANLFRDDAVHAISAAIDSQQFLHPIKHFTGGLSLRLWLRSISHVDRMQKSHAARSRLQHRTFVTEVNICAQLAILTVQFAFFHPASLQLLHRQHWECVHTTAHALETFPVLHSPNPNRNAT